MVRERTSGLLLIGEILLLMEALALFAQLRTLFDSVPAGEEAQSEAEPKSPAEWERVDRESMSPPAV